MVEASSWLWWRMRIGLMFGSICASADSGIISPPTLRTRTLSKDSGLNEVDALEVSTTQYWLMSE